jgi:hypothetical protein
MKEENLKFIFELVKRITDAKEKYRNNDCSIALEHNGGKDYYTIDIILKHCNSTYTDCVVFYLTENSFDPISILDEFDEIIRRGNLLFNKQ